MTALRMLLIYGQNHKQREEMGNELYTAFMQQIIKKNEWVI